MNKETIFNTLMDAAALCEDAEIAFDGIAFAGESHDGEDTARAKEALPTEREREAMLKGIQVTLLFASSLTIEKDKKGDPHRLLADCIGTTIENLMESRLGNFQCMAVQR